MRLALLCLVLAATSHAQIPPPVPAIPPAPDSFTTFEFESAPDQSALLSSFLWYHFHLRGGNGPVLFNKEYLTTADLWLNGTPHDSEQLIQEVHRAALQSMQLDPEGYVYTNQHFSHSHDLGWPFPLWTQSGRGPEETLGQTAGWHFQPLEAVQGWVKGFLEGWKDPRWYGEGAVSAWQLEGATSEEIVDNRWRLQTTGPDAALTSPADTPIDAFQAPFLQIRWTRSGTPPNHAAPYIEWQREGDPGFSPDRRMHFYPEKTPLSGPNFHSILALHRHPEWTGKIVRMRVVPAPGETGVTVDIDSIFTVYDTRHTINNSIYILTSGQYFNWTGDLPFLRDQINKMRLALRYQQTELGGLAHNFIRVSSWPGHDGLPGYETLPDGQKKLHGGHGIGSNYWDIMPFGGDDFYATYQYYAATRALAALEQAIRDNPGWDIGMGTLSLDPQELLDHAEEVKATANEKFWNATTGRFYSAIDVNGTARDYGHTFVNLDSIWYGIASDEHAHSILDWLTGTRTVEGDTSQAADIYHWRFGPRATTLRNVDWYGQGWHAPESLEWGMQVQDGGAVLGFTFYDLWARLKYLGPDNAWQRLTEILAWEAEVRGAGGYRAYYAPEHKRGSMQGGGTPGGLGIDNEFYESSLVPAIIPLGFLGLDATPTALKINPKLPSAIPSLAARNIRYHGAIMHVTARHNELIIELPSASAAPLAIQFQTPWNQEGSETPSVNASLRMAGTYRFTR